MNKILLILSLLVLLFLPPVLGQGKIDSLHHALDLVKNQQEEIQTLRLLGNGYLNNNPEKALYYSEKAYRLANQTNNSDEIYHTSLLISEITSKQSEFEKALDYAFAADKMAKESEDPKREGQVKILLANIHLAFSDLDKALELFFESLRIFEKIENKRGISVAINGIGIIYHDQGNLEKAQDYFEQCYDISKERGDNVALEAAICNLASIFYKDDLFNKSIRYYLEALELNREHSGSKFWECTILSNLGDSYQNSGALDIAYEYFLRAKALANHLNDYEQITASKNNLADYHFHIDDYDSCNYYALQSYDMAEKYHFPNYMMEAAELLHQSYAKQNNTDKAYEYAIIHSQLKDEYNLEETIRKTTQIELQYKVEKELQLQEIEFQRKKSFQIILGIIFFSVFIIVIILLITRNRMAIKNINLDKEKTEHKLEMRNKELAINVMTLLKKNDMLTAISEELYDVKNKALKSETKDAINKIAKKIKKSSEGELWKEFELRFKEVHSDFYDNLLEKHPSISPGEQRLCALLRLNMSTKEIAELTGQSTQTLEKARYRIRKKLELSNSSVNLVTYLSSL